MILNRIIESAIRSSENVAKITNLLAVNNTKSIENIERNFKSTPILRKAINENGHYWIVNETACPVQIRNYSTENPPKRKWPDAIGFGFGKCGTGFDKNLKIK